MQKTFDPCFCELAPLYALDMLEADDRASVEAQIEAQVAELPELQDELRDLQQTVSAIAYAAPPRELAPQVKSRLFDRLELLSSAPSPAPSTHRPELPPPDLRSSVKTVRSQALRWRAGRVAGVQVARLHLDTERREMTSLLRAEAGVVYPAHVHTKFEEIYMLSGDLRIGDQTYWAGDFIRSEAGSTHAPSTETGCMFIVRTSVDDEYPD
jgi:anti-sigma factor ChrR (cupin superfamily)